MILLQSLIAGTSYQIKPLEGQSFEKKLKRNVEDLRINAPIQEFAKHPLGAIFIATDYDFPEDDSLFIKQENVFPVMYNTSMLPTGITDPTLLQKPINYLIDYMIDHQDTYDMDTIKNIISQFNTAGYVCDAEARTAPRPIEEVLESAGTSLKRTIATSYPVPKFEDCGFSIDPELWYLLIRNTLKGENTLIIGPTGIV